MLDPTGIHNATGKFQNNTLFTVIIFSTVTIIFLVGPRNYHNCTGARLATAHVFLLSRHTILDSSGKIEPNENDG